jgi:hypothetical protein
MIFCRLAKNAWLGCRLGLGRHGGVEDGETVSATVLGLIHRDIGVLEQVVGVDALFRVGADSDADGDGNLPVSRFEGCGEGRYDLGRDWFSLLTTVQILKKNDEFIAADARHGVGLAHEGDEAFRDPAEQLISGHVAQGIIHFLESVEIDHHDSNDGPEATGPLQSHLEAVIEQSAIGQIR